MSEERQDIGGGRDFYPSSGFLHELLHLEHAENAEKPAVATMHREGKVAIVTHSVDALQQHIREAQNLDTEYVLAHFDDLLKEYLRQDDKIPQKIKIKFLKGEDIEEKVFEFMMKRFNKYLREVKNLNQHEVEA